MFDFSIVWLRHNHFTDRK